MYRVLGMGKHDEEVKFIIGTYCGSDTLNTLQGNNLERVKPFGRKEIIVRVKINTW